MIETSGRPGTGRRPPDGPMSDRQKGERTTNDDEMLGDEVTPEPGERIRTGAGDRPRTRIERPVSRRGSQTGGESRESLRSRTARPPSAYSAQRHRVGTSADVIRLNTGLPASSQIGIGVLDRPVTQQGISGVSSGTTRGISINRQIQDKRYYEGLVQLKIRELSREIGTMSREIDAQNRERSTFLHYDNRAKELAAELTDLQGQLADYNIVVDKSTSSSVDKNYVESETREMASENDRTWSEIEGMFEQRRSAEEQLRETDAKIDSEDARAATIIDSMDVDNRERYDRLNEDKSQLDSEIGKMQREIDALSSERNRLEGKISLSQVKQEAAKLRIKLSELERRRDKLREEETKKLSPEEERERLLSQVKRDNMDIAAAVRRIAVAEKRIDEVERELEQLEMDMEDGQTEKQTRYRELRKREEAMELFMPSFEQNKAEEIEKIESLEGCVVDRLERYSRAIDNDARTTPTEELALLLDKIATTSQSSSVSSLLLLSSSSPPSPSPSPPPSQDSAIADTHRSFEGLSREHGNLQRTLDKMEILERRLRDELNELNVKITERRNELVVLEDLDGFKARSELRHNQLVAEKENLTKRRPICRDEVERARKDYGTINDDLLKNETYLRINALEDKLRKLTNGNENIQRFITDEENRMNYQSLKERALLFLTRYNNFLGESTKTQLFPDQYNSSS